MPTSYTTNIYIQDTPAILRVDPRYRCLSRENTGMGSGTCSTLGWWCSLERDHTGPHTGYSDHNLRNAGIYSVRVWPNENELISGKRPLVSIKIE